MSLLISPTLQNLTSSVRMRLKQKDPQNSFWSDSEIAEYLNDGVRQYFLECVLVDEGYFTVETGGSISDLNIVSGQETIALPSDCFSIKNVWKLASNEWIELPYRNNVNQGYTTLGGTSQDLWFPYYYFQGNNLVFRDTPNFSQTGGIRLEYIQFPDNLVWGGDTLTSQVSPIFKELIIMYAVYQCKLTESMVNGGTMHLIPQQQLGVLYTSFKNTIVRRSKGPTFIQPWNPES